jgi:hypothetical protein
METETPYRPEFRKRKAKRGKVMTAEQAEIRAVMLNALVRHPKISYRAGALDRNTMGVIQYYGDEPVGIA